jgi:hypothetical protein
MRKLVIDAGSETWQAVEAYANEQIQILRLRNDSPALDKVSTAVTRGRIAAMKDLLALGKAPAQPVDEGGPPVY